MFFTRSNRISTIIILSNIILYCTAVAKMVQTIVIVHGLLEREKSEGHLQSYTESTNTKTRERTKKRRRLRQKRMPERIVSIVLIVLIV